MSPGRINFLFNQAQYQHTVNINFKKKWYQRVNKIVELNMVQVAIIAFISMFIENILTYSYHCLLYYTH